MSIATPNDVLKRAAQEIGYSRWNDPLQGTVYGRWYAKVTKTPYFGMNGVPYCAMFVSYILDQVGQSCKGFPTASCATALNGARTAGLVIANKKDARPGDIVIFDWPNVSGGSDHVGFVELNNGSYIQTIEGNTSSGNSGSQSNGGGVYRRTRDWSVVQAIIRPVYSGASAPSKPNTGGSTSKPSSTKLEVDGWIGKASWTEMQKQLGCKVVDGIMSSQPYSNQKYIPNVACETIGNYGSTSVEKLQLFLRKKGYDVKADGYFGPNTVLALQKWMTRDLGYKKHGHDSILGIITAYNIQNALNAGVFKS